MNQKIKRASIALSLGLVCTATFAQQRQITGTVKDASGEPMIGVTIDADGQVAAVTDMDGRFTIKDAKPGTKLTISYVGYSDQSFTVGNKSTFDVVMKEDNQQLDEVVVVGYGTMKKKDLTGSVASIKSDDIKNVAASDALTAMQA
jgi:hypothetical protein